MRASNTIEQHRPTRPPRARLALVDAAYTRAARNGYDEYYGSEKDGRLKQTSDPAGRATVFDYDPNGNAISVTLVPNDGGTNRVTLTDYDELNRPIRNVGPVTSDLALGQYRPVTKNAYDNLGNLIAVAAGRTDLTGTNPGLDIVSPQMNYTFDDFGRKIKETDPLGKFWKFEYDQHNNLTKSTDAKYQITQFIYSNYGQLLSRTDHTGKKTTYSYNALGQVLTAQSPEVTYSHTYDSAHRLASVTDSRGGKKLSYAYSPGGLLNTLADNEGHRTDYLYDAVGRLTGIWAPNNDYVAFVFDAGGRLSEKWFPNGVNAQYTWNNDNTLAQVRNRFNYSDTFVVSQHDYTYNGVGQRQGAQDKLGIYAPPAMNETYAYDPLGNRTTRNDGSSKRSLVSPIRGEEPLAA
jgi:YD repeat-containing protein